MDIAFDATPALVASQRRSRRRATPLPHRNAKGRCEASRLPYEPPRAGMHPRVAIGAYLEGTGCFPGGLGRGALIPPAFEADYASRQRLKVKPPSQSSRSGDEHRSSSMPDGPRRKQNPHGTRRPLRWNATRPSKLTRRTVPRETSPLPPLLHRHRRSTQHNFPQVSRETALRIWRSTRSIRHDGPLAFASIPTRPPACPPPCGFT